MLDLEFLESEPMSPIYLQNHSKVPTFPLHFDSVSQMTGQNLLVPDQANYFVFPNIYINTIYMSTLPYLRCVVGCCDGCLWTKQLSFGSYPPANSTDDDQDLRDTWFPKARDCTCCKVSCFCVGPSERHHIKSPPHLCCRFYFRFFFFFFCYFVYSSFGSFFSVVLGSSLIYAPTIQNHTGNK